MISQNNKTQATSRTTALVPDIWDKLSPLSGIPIPRLLACLPACLSALPLNSLERTHGWLSPEPTCCDLTYLPISTTWFQGTKKKGWSVGRATIIPVIIADIRMSTVLSYLSQSQSLSLSQSQSPNQTTSPKGQGVLTIVGRQDNISSSVLARPDLDTYDVLYRIKASKHARKHPSVISTVPTVSIVHACMATCMQQSPFPKQS